MPIPSHGIAQRLPSRIVAGENLQFAAAIMIEPLDAPLASHCGLLRVVIGAAGCARIVYVDHLVSIGKELFEAVHQIGAEGIVSKRRGSLYRGGESPEWLKTKCSETGVFAITGFSELGEGRLDAFYVAEARNGVLCPAGQVRFL